MHLSAACCSHQTERHSALACRFDLTLEMTHDSAKDEVAGHIEYRTDLFKRSTIEALVSHFAVSETHLSWRVAVSAKFEQPGL